MARKPKNFDKTTFEKLCGLHCTKEEICSFFECSEKTLNRWCKREYGTYFSPIYKSKQDIGKISLRRTQWRMAETIPTMAIWLGKQCLGQSDNPKQEQAQNEILQGLIDLLDKRDAE